LNSPNNYNNTKLNSIRCFYCARETAVRPVSETAQEHQRVTFKKPQAETRRQELFVMA